jgi:chitinase
VIKTVTFAPGAVNGTVKVPILGDTTDEPNETFTLTLINPNGLTIGDGTAIGTITDDD